MKKNSLPQKRPSKQPKRSWRSKRSGNRIEEAAIFAYEHHIIKHNQKYGKRKSYLVHLLDVAKVIMEFKDLFDPSELEILLCAAWLHDILEDCKEVKYGDLKDKFGVDVADVVLSVTNPDLSSYWARHKYRKLGMNFKVTPLGEPLKAADRIANMRCGAKNTVYSAELHTFKQYCCSGKKYAEMWDVLDTLAHPNSDL